VIARLGKNVLQSRPLNSWHTSFESVYTFRVALNRSDPLDWALSTTLALVAGSGQLDNIELALKPL
jgi:hypothetical protein